MAWTDWESSCRLDLDRVPATQGVYYVRATKGNRPVRIGRLLAADDTGTLYIGMTSGRANAGLRWRLQCFWDAANGKFHFPHPGGVRFFALGPELFPPRGLQVCWRRTRSGEDARRVERECLEHYERRFGELPPLNRSGGRRISNLVRKLKRTGSSVNN